MRERAQRDDRVADLDDHRELSAQERRQAEASAQAWSQWSDTINTRLASLEARVMLYLGLNDSEEEHASVLTMVVGQLMDDVEDLVESKLKTALTALREETQVELALVRDELNGRIDQKLYGSGLDIDAEEMRRAVFELRKDVAQRFDDTSTNLDQLAKRIDATDKRRRYDRNTARTEIGDATQKLDKLSAARATVLETKLAKVTADLAELTAACHEAFDERPGRR